LPDAFRIPVRGTAPHLNMASLALIPPKDYLIGPGDTLQVLVPGLFETTMITPFTVRVGADGSVVLPSIGKANVGGQTLGAAQLTIEQAYSSGILVNPRVNVSLAAKGTYNVSVIGEVRQAGAFDLPRYEDDLAHAIARAGGLTDRAAARVEIHRRATPRDIVEILGQIQPDFTAGENLVLVIPLEGQGATVYLDGVPPRRKILTANDVELRAGDVVVVPRRTDEVFFVVGPLNRSNVLNFSVQDQDRRLGNAFLLPRDRDIDVVTAVAMAGYIDPIDSPSTVTVQRSMPGQSPLLIRVDLIAARANWKENLYVQPGDIIYLNPDLAWWWRRTFDRVIPQLITIPYAEGIGRWINPSRRF